MKVRREGDRKLQFCYNIVRNIQKHFFVSDTHQHHHRALRGTKADIERLLQSADSLGLSENAREKLCWFSHAIANGGNVRKTCEHFGIAPSTFARWARRFDPADPASLEERSKRPQRMRKTSVPPEIVERIRQYRTEDPRMSRDRIREKLIAEHGVTLSSSSIGRVIRNHGFFFAQTPAHWLKRAGNADAAVTEEAVTDRLVAAEVQATHAVFAEWAANLDRCVIPSSPRSQTEGVSRDGGATQDDTTKSSGTTHLSLIIFLASSLVFGSLLGGSKAYALEGSSYRLYGDFAGEAGAGVLAGSTNTLEEGRATDTSQPLTGGSYQIVSAPPSAASSSSTSSSSSSSAGGGGGGGGGCRTPPCRQEPSSSSSTSSPAEPPSEEAPEEPAPPVPPAAEPPHRAAPPQFPVPTPAGVRVSTAPPPASTFRFFDLLDPSCRCPDILHSAAPIAGIGLWHLIGISLTGGIIGLLSWLYLQWKRFPFLFFLPIGGVWTDREEKEKRKHRGSFRSHPVYRRHRDALRSMELRTKLALIVVALLAGAMLFLGVTRASAATTAPLTHTYHGHLLDSSGNAVTTAVTIRYTYWKSADFTAGDLTATGAINTSASNYVSWKEEHTVTPNSDGYFSVELGSVTALPTMNGLPLSTLLSLFLQVEVKTSGAADSTYDLLDANTGSATVDRSSILSVPFALNADMLDQRDTGTASGSIPVLQNGGVLGKAQIPSGTTQSGFTLNSGNAATGDITLQFGQTLGKKLSYSQSNSWFNFNDDVNIQGDLTVTGLINGTDITAAQSSTGALKVYSGGGLTIKVSQGSYRLKGITTNYTGNSGIAVTANATNYVFFGSGGLTVRTATFPTDESYIPLAEIVTNASSVTTTTDRRALQSDDRERTLVRTYHAGFEGASYQGDASDNVGQLYTDHDNTNDFNYYRWSSSASTLQDYDIILRTTLPRDFVRWNTGSGNHLRIKYRTTSASADDSQLDISVFDTNGSPVSLSGSGLSSGQNLVNTSWITEQIEWTGTPTWTAGQDFLVRLKLQARSDKQIHVGDLILEYVELPSE